MVYTCERCMKRLTLFLPVAAGMWKQHQLWDGTYTLDDLLDIVELIRVRRMNEMRAREAQNG